MNKEVYNSILAEAKELMESHQSKDCRFFARSVYNFLYNFKEPSNILYLYDRNDMTLSDKLKGLKFSKVIISESIKEKESKESNNAPSKK